MGVEEVFLDRVLAGDLWRYFLEIPHASDEWWELLRDGVMEFWGASRSLTGSGLPPVHRICGWLVEQDRRADAASVMTWVASLDGPAPQTGKGEGRHVDVPSGVLDLSTVGPDALALRPYEIR
jgi:CDP-glycerol glycerophosphotransferase